MGKAVTDKLGSVTLDKDETLVSLDVESLFINVPVREAIDVTAELLYTSGFKMPHVDRTAFPELLEVVSINALFLTKSGSYRQAECGYGKSSWTIVGQRFHVAI